MNDVFSASMCHECFPSLLIGRSRCCSPNQDGDHPGRACCRRCRSVFKESSSPGESVPPDTGGPGCEGVIDPGEGLQRPGGEDSAWSWRPTGPRQQTEKPDRLLLSQGQ